VNHQLPLQENYYDLKRELQRLWKLSPSTSFELFPSPYQSVYEITMGLQQVFPMRKLCLFQKGFHPYADELALRFARQGYRIEWIDIDGTLLENFKEKSREILFLLYSEDQPFTAEYLNDDALKRFHDFASFSLGLKFVGYARNEEFTPASPTQSLIHVLSDGRCLTTLGSRFRISLTLSSHLLPSFLSLQDWQGARQPLVEDEKLVREAEAFVIQTLGGVAHPLSHSRYYDRALMAFGDLDATALRSLMCEKDKRYEALIPLGLNFHRSDKSLKWMIKDGTTFEDLQGRLAAPLSCMGASFQSDLKDSVRELRELQTLNL
jgi:hypothetical protein